MGIVDRERIKFASSEVCSSRRALKKKPPSEERMVAMRAPRIGDNRREKKEILSNLEISR